MPGDFDVVSASAGDMFMGAFVPGLILVGIYMLYILISALIKPEKAPPVPFAGKYDHRFFIGVVLALVPPLTLIFIVLGSIILGVATVNQAGAIGAIGAMMMGSYRLMEGKPRAYWPAAMAIGAVVTVAILMNFFDLNIKNIQSGYDALGIVLAGIAALVLLCAIGWAIWRAYKIDDTLNAVMLDTAKTTSMVFIILLGAAMLTSAFRGFGGEELVKEHLTALPGGFWTQFIVVMAVIFFLGFFLDFLEIAVVVVPIVAPILLADPSANVTAVWFGVMVGLNIQTSFLTPPFGFSLFYLRGVAPPSVKTTQIYKGAAAFIALQLLGLAIAGVFPNLVNYLPNKTHLISETAPPPSNPKLQECLEDYLFEQYDEKRKSIESAIERIQGANLAYLPDEYQDRLHESYREAGAVFGRVEAAREAERRVRDYAVDYRPLHVEVRQIQSDIRDLGKEIEELDQTRQRLRYAETLDEDRIAEVERGIDLLEKQQQELQAKIPDTWEDARAGFAELAKAEKRARLQYRQSVDDSYATIKLLLRVIDETDALVELEASFEPLRTAIREQTPDEAMATIEALETRLNQLAETHRIVSKLSRARRELRGQAPDLDKAAANIAEAEEVFRSEVAWRQRAANEFSGDLDAYNQAIADTIGIRMQARINEDQADSVASCLAVHKDLTLYF